VTSATPRRAAFLIAFALVGVVPGCGQAPQAARPEPPPQPARPSSPAPDPVTVCVNQLTYWAGEDLRGQDGEGYDYQHRGLTAQQADALRAIVAEAQALAPDRATGLVAERVRAACEGIAGAG
jgi:hypothetical protein